MTRVRTEKNTLQKGNSGRTLHHTASSKEVLPRFRNPTVCMKGLNGIMH